MIPVLETNRICQVAALVEVARRQESRWNSHSSLCGSHRCQRLLRPVRASADSHAAGELAKAITNRRAPTLCSGEVVTDDAWKFRVCSR